MSNDNQLHVITENISEKTADDFDANMAHGDIAARAYRMADAMESRKRVWADLDVDFDPDFSSLLWRNRGLLVKVYADTLLSVTDEKAPDSEFSKWRNKTEKYYRVTLMIISRITSNGFVSVKEVQEWASQGEYIAPGCDETEARLSISNGTVRAVFDYGEELGILRRSKTRKGFVFTRLGRSQLYDRVIEKLYNKDLQRLASILNTLKAAEKMIRKTKTLEDEGNIVKVADSLVSLAWEGDT